MTIKFKLISGDEPKVEFSGKFNISKFNTFINESKIDKSKITKITVGKNVTDLDSKIFMNLNNLVKVELNKSNLTHYGYLTFKNCVKLNNIIDSPNLKKLNNSTFRNTGFKTYKCPDSLKEITNYNFKDSIKLEEVNLNNLETLGKENFKNCASLNIVTLSKNLETTGVRNFENCHKLTKVNFNDTEKLETIGQSSFYNCSGLKSIDFPKSLKTIGVSSFQNTGLENIIIRLRSSSEKITISKNAFKNTKNLKNIFLGNDIEVIPDAFNFSINDIKPNIYFYDNVHYLLKGKIDKNKNVIKTEEQVNVFDENKNMLPEFEQIKKKGRFETNAMIFIPPLDTVYIANKRALDNYNNKKTITLNKIEFTKITTDKIPNKAGTYNIDYEGINDGITYAIKEKIMVDTGNITVTNKEDNHGGKNIVLVSDRIWLAGNKKGKVDINSYIGNDKYFNGKERKYPLKANIKTNNSLIEYYKYTDNFFEKMKENKILDNDGKLISGSHNKSFNYNYSVRSTFPNKNVQVKGVRNVIVLIDLEGKIVVTTLNNSDGGETQFLVGSKAIKNPLKNDSTGIKVYYEDVPYKNRRILFGNAPYSSFFTETPKITSNWDDVIKDRPGNYKVTFSLIDSLGKKVEKSYDIKIIGKDLHSTVLGTGAFAKHGKNLNTYNVVIGNEALKDIDKSHRNVAIGSLSMSESKVKSDSNTAVGYNSLSNATNARNIGIGVNVGKNIRNGIDNILIGKNTDVTINKSKDIYGSNQIVIGNDAQGDDDSILLNQKNILPGKKDISLGDKDYKFDNIYSTKIVNGDLQLTLPTNKLSGDRYLEVDGDGNIKFITLENILAGL